jgi:hypothetical protein
LPVREGEDEAMLVAQILMRKVGGGRAEVVGFGKRFNTKLFKLFEVPTTSGWGAFW